RRGCFRTAEIGSATESQEQYDQYCRDDGCDDDAAAAPAAHHGLVGGRTAGRRRRWVRRRPVWIAVSVEFRHSTLPLSGLGKPKRERGIVGSLAEIRVAHLQMTPRARQ